MTFLLPPLVAWLIAQVAKVALSSFRLRRLNLRVLADPGGMPSSHSAIVMGLTTAVGKHLGWSTAPFAIALIFSFVVMYDAAGVRRAAGRQAAVLNRLVQDLVHMRGVQETELRELLGHTPVEVLVGAVLGVAVAFLPFL
jgi:acid phosphatase family membrane protein YuiD